ncbi:hypothetical protein [Gymnodinialimonas hymeniacidonis]|uniref:hypothetical protein n=1 Tax=Gymnodinialimonas hymeniacidonis TaxID=3126508 RepID=UPI0034C677EE
MTKAFSILALTFAVPLCTAVPAIACFSDHCPTQEVQSQDANRSGLFPGGATARWVQEYWTLEEGHLSAASAPGDVPAGSQQVVNPSTGVIQSTIGDPLHISHSPNAVHAVMLTR